VFETFHRRKDGSVFPVETSSRMISLGGESFLLSIIRDITQRKAHEREIERMNRLYAALSQVNQTVVRATSREELLADVCRVLVQFGGFQMAWVGWVDESTPQVLPLAQFGDELGYLKQIRVFADERPEGHGPVGVAIREGHPCVCHDIPGDARMLPWREAAARCGWCSLAAFPIRQEGHIRGALAVYARQDDFFGPKERVLLEEAAVDISFGLDTLLNDQRRKEGEAALRQSEQQLRALAGDLDRLVQERTAQLREANDNLQVFAYTAAHDLRAPLRAISSFAFIVSGDYGPKLDVQGRSLLERITQSVGQMSGLLNDLLEYSRISQADLHLEPLSLQESVKNALALLDADIRARNASVTVADDLPEVIGHPATVVLLINNLVSNALKFVPAGVQPQVRVWAETVQSRGSKTRSMEPTVQSQPDAGNQESGSTAPSLSPQASTHNRLVRLWVEDNGIGIALEHLPKLFGVFQRLHGKQDYAGTGLGLAIVRKGVERMGGRVGVESEPGKGSRFWIELPKAEVRRET
jgi:signal transduction histidine kinase